ncbi:HlyD family secretion protein [Thalassolituus hydrocarboniclasticus]|uniref:HlyD family secretion protein n=1 Tax=Thalassolituus hydrocarboniclasticus TaxID=2742796 RepID=A0ABY6A6N6_9GAMM|nr:HlyD family secretion protein [Thalassolituus hydrocarboniclasticus]UXD86325.1 HlyD family secretion protein [Thalassolituus hydrocarboniclasticus]
MNKTENSGSEAAVQQLSDDDVGNPARKVAVPLLSVLLLLIVWYAVSDRVSPYSGRGAVSAYVAQLAARVPGQVTEVLVQDGDVVEAGTLLFRLDPRPFELAVRQAEARLARAVQSSQAGAASIISSQARVAQARAQLENVRATTNRTLSLERRGLVSLADADNARAGLLSAEADAEKAEADLQSAILELGAQGENNPEIQAARADLEKAQLDRHFAEVEAPTRGVITNLHLAVGQYVAAGSAAVTFIDARGAWITADLRENQIGHVVTGDEVDILFDAMPGTIFRGHVQSLAWGIDPGRPYAGGLAQNQPENDWFEPARRIPVRIELSDSLDAWPAPVKAGGKVAVVVYAGGRNNPVSWIAAGLLRIKSYLSYLY